MSEQRLRITGMTCASCQQHVRKALEQVPGVHTARVNLLMHVAEIEADPSVTTPQLIAAVRSAGYEANTNTSTDPATGPTPTDETHLGLRAALTLLAGAFAMLFSMPLMATANTPDPLLNWLAAHTMPLLPAGLMQLPATPLRWTLCLLALIIILFAAPDIYRAAWRAALHRTTNMNTLIALGTLTAFAASLAATAAPIWFAAHNLRPDVYFEAVILILAFLLTGRWLEARARHRATNALRAFAQLETSDARFLADSLDALPNPLTAPETLLPLDAIALGDILRVLPGDRIPLDAVILFGQSSIDESMLTGEPLPITRTPGNRVFAGTLNLDGALILRATALGADSTLAQMRRLLEQAQTSRAPMERLADRASAIFVPCVLILAAACFAAWSIASNTGAHHLGYSLPLTIAISVLIVACPCAMGLAVPAAATVALGRAAQLGLLIKGAETLERLATIDTIALDKTGTLTQGRPTITSFKLAPNATFDKPALLAYAAAAEQLSTHPLANAIVTFAGQQPTHSVSDFLILPGTGLTCTIDNHHISITNTAPQTIEPTTGTPIHLYIDDVLQATFIAHDELRPEATEAIATLKALHLEPTLLTGDTLSSAQPIAFAAGIANVHAALLPADKLTIIHQLQSQGKQVAMAGDGINDAAALAQANVGFAMASGTDLAREAGDILLLHHDLRLIPTAIRLARRTLRIMRQNLGWAMAYNLIALPLAAGVLYPRFHILLSPIVASAAMALSSVSVLVNSLRLRTHPR